jgi:hypothetical protein
MFAFTFAIGGHFLAAEQQLAEDQQALASP